MKPQFFWLVIFCLITSSSYAVDPQNPFRGILPVMQGSTSEGEVHFSALVPRLLDLTIKAKLKNPKDKRNNPEIRGQVVGEPQQDPQGLLHEKVVKFKVSGLNANTEYVLEISAASKGSGPSFTDIREFKTLNNAPDPVKFATISCMCDEVHYEDTRQAIWRKLVEQNPDIVFLIGDQTYVDSFHYVTRNTATSLDVWMRYFRSFDKNPYFRSYRLIPTAATWDDHDTGVDNGNKNTPTLAEARRAFKALYGGMEIPGWVETWEEGFYQHIKMRGQNFILLDNRTFRETHEVNTRYAHFGEEQEVWLVHKMQSGRGPFFIFNGDMWGSPTVTSTRPDGSTKRVTESVFGDHPAQYEGLMQAINETGKAYVLLSGDIHASQIIEHGPQYQGPRKSPFRTLEITSSPMHSFVFKPKPGEDILWPDLQRLVGVKDYNFIMVESEALPTNAVDIKATSIGMQKDPLFQFGTTVFREDGFQTSRRKILDRGFAVNNGKVKVAFFDADSTLRLAPSKSVSANGATDVAILPGVADKIAELNAQEFLVTIVSNQGGVAEGHVRYEVAESAIKYTMELIAEQNPRAKIHYFDMAERGHGDYFTKPNIGMAKYLESVLRNEGIEIDWNNSFMVGDSRYKKTDVTPRDTAGSDFSNADRLFAQNLDIRNFDPRVYFGWSTRDYQLINRGDIPRSCKDLL